MDYVILINKENPIDNNYKVENLIEVSTRIEGTFEVVRKISLNKTVYLSWLKMAKEVAKIGFDLDLEAGYRLMNIRRKFLIKY